MSEQVKAPLVQTPQVSRNGPMLVKATEVLVRGQERRRTSVMCFNERGDWVGTVQVVASPAGRRCTVRLLGDVRLETPSE